MYNFTSDRTKNISNGVKEILSPFSKTPKNMMSMGIEVYAKLLHKRFLYNPDLIDFYFQFQKTHIFFSYIPHSVFSLYSYSYYSF